MLLIAFSLVFFASFLFILAWRGRVVARGQFCKKCRFDLAGLDLESPEAKCPECGSEIHRVADQRVVLRRKSWVGLSIAAMLLLAGVGVLGFGIFGNTSKLIAAMPDPIVLKLTDWGVDEALDELVVRTSKVPSTMSAGSWDNAIEQGLAFQADTRLVWDVRWGEVLFLGLAQGMLTDSQLERYFLNIYMIDLAVRDRVHPGDDWVGYKMDWKLTRHKMLTGGMLDYDFYPRVVSYGVVGQEPSWEMDDRRRRRGGSNGVWLFPYANNEMSMWTRASELSPYFDQAPGEKIDVFFEYEATLKTLDDDEPIFVDRVRKEFTIEIIDPEEPIVHAYQDDTAAQLAIESIGIGPLQIMGEIEEARPNTYTNVLTGTLRSDVGLAQLSLEIYLLFDEREVLIGKVNYNFSPESFGAHIGWSIRPGDTDALNLARAVHAKLIADQSATIIVRTNPELLNDVPGIDRVLDVKFMFEDVSIMIVESADELRSPDWEAARIKAQPLDD